MRKSRPSFHFANLAEDVGPVLDPPAPSYERQYNRSSPPSAKRTFELVETAKKNMQNYKYATRAAIQAIQASFSYTNIVKSSPLRFNPPFEKEEELQHEENVRERFDEDPKSVNIEELLLIVGDKREPARARNAVEGFAKAAVIFADALNRLSIVSSKTYNHNKEKSFSEQNRLEARAHAITWVETAARRLVRTTTRAYEAAAILRKDMMKFTVERRKDIQDVAYIIDASVENCLDLPFVKEEVVKQEANAKSKEGGYTRRRVKNRTRTKRLRRGS
jgi:hypothetical protein